MESVAAQIGVTRGSDKKGHDHALIEWPRLFAYDFTIKTMKFARWITDRISKIRFFPSEPSEEQLLQSKKDRVRATFKYAPYSMNTNYESNKLWLMEIQRLEEPIESIR